MAIAEWKQIDHFLEPAKFEMYQKAVDYIADVHEQVSKKEFKFTFPYTNEVLELLFFVAIIILFAIGLFAPLLF